MFALNAFVKLVGSMQTCGTFRLESVRVKNEARVEEGAVGRGVLMPRAARSTIDLRSTARRARASFGPGGRCCSAEIPAQAQVAAWARGRERHAAGPRAAGPGELARAPEQAVGRAVAARCWAARVLAGPKWPNE